GVAIASYAIKCSRAFLYVRGEFALGHERVAAALAEAYAHGALGKNIFGSGFDLEVVLHPGAGAYICGEETALLNSLEGKRGEPRLKPPFPAQVGAFGMPSTVNNLETIAAVPNALAMGGEAFSKLSDIHHLKDGGCRLFGLSDKACPVLAMHNLMRFYRHESCGQCTPCREGSAWLLRVLDRIVAGEATIEELDGLHEIADNIMGNTICAFGEGTAMPALGFL